MEIVTVIPIGIIAGQMRAGQIPFIGMGRFGIALGRLVIHPDASVDMRRHMDQVARAGHEPGKTVGTSQRALRFTRSFDSVNIVMTGAGMVWLLVENRLERRNNFLSPGLRGPLRGPKV